VFEPIETIRRSLTAAALCFGLALLGLVGVGGEAIRLGSVGVGVAWEGRALPAESGKECSSGEENSGRTSGDTEPGSGKIHVRARRGPRASGMNLAAVVRTIVTTCEKPGGLPQRLDPEEPPLWRHGNDTVRLRC
jgi:hypothetical protein